MQNWQSLLNEIYLWPAIYARRGIKVVLGAEEAFYRNGEIHIPMPTSENIPLARGYVAHESMHQNHTDFSLYENASGLEHWLMNLFDDAQGERQHLLEFPGDHVNFEAICTLIGDGYQPPSSMEELFTSYMLQYVRGPIGDYASNEAQVKRAGEMLLAHAGQDTFDAVKAFCDEVPAFTSTAQCADLAQRVIAWMKAKSDEGDGNQNQQGDGSQSQQGNGSQSQQGKGNQSPQHPASHYALHDNPKKTSV